MASKKCKANATLLILSSAQWSSVPGQVSLRSSHNAKPLSSLTRGNKSTLGGVCPSSPPPGGWKPAHTDGNSTRWWRKSCRASEPPPPPPLVKMLQPVPASGGGQLLLVPTSILDCARLQVAYLPGRASQWATLEQAAEWERVRVEWEWGPESLFDFWGHQDGLLQRRHTRLRHHLQPGCRGLVGHRLQHRQLADHPREQRGGAGRAKENLSILS